MNPRQKLVDSIPEITKAASKHVHFQKDKNAPARRIPMKPPMDAPEKQRVQIATVRQMTATVFKSPQKEFNHWESPASVPRNDFQPAAPRSTRRRTGNPPPRSARLPWTAALTNIVGAGAVFAVDHLKRRGQQACGPAGSEMVGQNLVTREPARLVGPESRNGACVGIPQLFPCPQTAPHPPPARPDLASDLWTVSYNSPSNPLS